MTDGLQIGMDRPRTPEMFRVMAAIQKCYDETGYTPLYREIAELAKMSVPSVCRRVKELQSDGWIALVPNRRRAIVILRRLPVPLRMMWEKRRKRA